MAYDTVKLGDRVNKVTAEVGGKGTAGLYEHPASGEQMATFSDPLFGEAQSNAAVQLGFVRIGDVPEGYAHYVDISELTRDQGSTDSMKGLTARMNQLETVQSDNDKLKAQIAELQAAAAAQVPAYIQTQPTADEAAAAKPLSAQDTTELLATAEREGVDVSGVDQTDNTKLVEVIQTARDSKESENN